MIGARVEVYLYCIVVSQLAIAILTHILNAIAHSIDPDHAIAHWE
ncbi:hypothetical protein [Coleofasciculus sp.]